MKQRNSLLQNKIRYFSTLSCSGGGAHPTQKFLLVVRIPPEYPLLNSFFWHPQGWCSFLVAPPALSSTTSYAQDRSDTPCARRRCWQWHCPHQTRCWGKIKATDGGTMELLLLRLKAASTILRMAYVLIFTWWHPETACSFLASSLIAKHLSP